MCAFVVEERDVAGEDAVHDHAKWIDVDLLIVELLVHLEQILQVTMKGR